LGIGDSDSVVDRPSLDDELLKIEVGRREAARTHRPDVVVDPHVLLVHRVQSCAAIDRSPKLAGRGNVGGRHDRAGGLGRDVAAGRQVEGVTLDHGVENRPTARLEQARRRRRRRGARGGFRAAGDGTRPGTSGESYGRRIQSSPRSVSWSRRRFSMRSEVRGWVCKKDAQRCSASPRSERILSKNSRLSAVSPKTS